MKVKAAELKDAALDWAVAKCEGWNVSVDEFLRSQLANSKFAYSTVWAKGGPIIEREEINTLTNCGQWQADIDDGGRYYGPTPLIAAMRCYVASKLGDEIEVPDQLL